MIKFSDVCADYSIPYFNEECSKKMMQEINLDQEIVSKCMTNEITRFKDEVNKQDSLIINDYESFKNNRIYRYPQIEINGTKYKGSWFGKHVFNSICANSNNPVCAKEIVTDYEYDGRIFYEVPTWLVILIVFAVLLILVLVILCYRRYVNKLIETSIESRIFSQTNNSIGNYTKMDKDTISIK